jgi:hypothetical protein
VAKLFGGSKIIFPINRRFNSFFENNSLSKELTGVFKEFMRKPGVRAVTDGIAIGSVFAGKYGATNVSHGTIGLLRESVGFFEGLALAFGPKIFSDVRL